MVRDVLMSGTVGFLASCAAGFIVHRELWKNANQQAKELNGLVGGVSQPASTSKERLVRFSLSTFSLRMQSCSS